MMSKRTIPISAIQRRAFQNCAAECSRAVEVIAACEAEISKQRAILERAKAEANAEAELLGVDTEKESYRPVSDDSGDRLEAELVD